MDVAIQEQMTEAVTADGDETKPVGPGELVPEHRSHFGGSPLNGT